MGVHAVILTCRSKHFLISENNKIDEACGKFRYQLLQHAAVAQARLPPPRRLGRLHSVQTHKVYDNVSQCLASNYVVLS